jgi:hypothetical protein
MIEAEMMPKTVPERLSAIEAHVTIIRERADQDRDKADRRADETSRVLNAIDMNVSLAAAETKRIGALLTEGEARFKTHEERITALETWRAGHLGKGGLLNWLLGTLLAIAGTVALIWTAMRTH